MIMNRNTIIIIFFFFLLPCLLLADLENNETPETAELVQLRSGQIRGITDGEVRAFLGIPYAAPPIGNLRWRPPQDVIPWNEVRECTEFGPACPQPVSVYQIDKMSEDCLSLNIWTPAKDSSERLPVMVWIHGGGFSVGSGGVKKFDGKNLAKKGVVVVTINYRLGPLGFLVHPLLQEESKRGVAGNYGLLDQIAALKWIYKNIRAFGGDRKNVTIFGESAGAASVLFLTLSPLSKILFHRAIAQSGSPLMDRYIFPRANGRMKQAMETGKQFGKLLGCDTSEDPLACMREKTADEIVKAVGFNIGLFSEGLQFAPVIDGWVVPDDPVILFYVGKQHNIPLIIGATANEGSIFMKSFTVDQYESWVHNMCGSFADKVLELFPVENQDDVLNVFSRLFTVLVFVQPARFIADSMRTQRSPAYLYQFTHIPPTKKGKMIGAYHGVEIPYVFGNLDKSTGYGEEDYALSQKMIHYWITFAATGNPNASELPEWPAYDRHEDQYLDFGDEVKVKSGLDKKECDLIDRTLR